MLESIQINEESGVPVWIQIRSQMIFAIKSGEIKAGESLPTVRTLASQLGVSYNTIHRVYRDLETDKLIDSRRGRRSFVNGIRPDDLELPASPVDVIIDQLVRAAKECCVPRESVIMSLQERWDRDDTQGE